MSAPASDLAGGDPVADHPIALPVVEMGTQAARVLAAKLDHQTDIESLCLPGNIIERASTAPVA